MKIKTILLLVALALLTCSCGSDDEPQVTQSTMKDVNHGKTMFAGTDIYLDEEQMLICPSEDYCISLCKSKELESIDAQQVNMSMNHKMKVYLVVFLSSYILFLVAPNSINLEHLSIIGFPNSS